MLRNFVVWALAFGMFAVVLGAFGAHALQEILTLNNTIEIYKTASLYHYIHVLLILIIGLSQKDENPLIKWALRSLFGGIGLFSGSLYILAISNIHWLGALTPVGGLLLIIGWALLAYNFYQSY